MTLFDGLGATSKDVICGKRTHPLAELHRKATYPFGTEYWDDRRARAHSLAKDDYGDPCVTFVRTEPPYKNASVVELKQGDYDPTRQFQSEMTFEYRGQQARRQPPCPYPATQVDLGNFPRLMETQYQADSKPGQSIPPTFDGQSKWPKIPAVDPLTGIIRTHKDPRFCEPFGRRTANFSSTYESGTRDPILGVVKPRAPHPKPTAAEVVARANTETPPLRSLGAVRPHFST
eukprot:GEMP01066020.1.p1 GENE.GEMP01066020.1~~GEMP01066020.1.p1  ORF type:complete len:232 (+),score=44.58 GEMP01066020.1:216-911(+)